MDFQSRKEVALLTVLAVFSHHAVNNYYETVHLQLEKSLSLTALKFLIKNSSAF